MQIRGFEARYSQHLDKEWIHDVYLEKQLRARKVIYGICRNPSGPRTVPANASASLLSYERRDARKAINYTLAYTL